MKRAISRCAVAALAIGTFSILGCESPNQTDLPSNERGTTAGGNGAFGENPAHPGDYNTGNNSYNSAGQPSSHNN